MGPSEDSWLCLRVLSSKHMPLCTFQTAFSLWVALPSHICGPRSASHWFIYETYSLSQMPVCPSTPKMQTCSRLWKIWKEQKSTLYHSSSHSFIWNAIFPCSYMSFRHPTWDSSCYAWCGPQPHSMSLVPCFRLPPFLAHSLFPQLSQNLQVLFIQCSRIQLFPASAPKLCSKPTFACSNPPTKMPSKPMGPCGSLPSLSL